VGQRGVNDWTPLHYAVVERDLDSNIECKYGNFAVATRCG